jgi:hypothetical protein
MWNIQVGQNVEISISFMNSYGGTRKPKEKWMCFLNTQTKATTNMAMVTLKVVMIMVDYTALALFQM